LTAAQQTRQRLLEHQLTPAAMVQAALGPAATIGTLLLCVSAFDVPLGGPYLILALIVFSLTFPGSAPRETRMRALASEVLASWLTIVALLLLIGWVTETLGSLDQRVMLAWVAATPVALVSTHLLMPRVLPRLLAAEGVQRVAVIVGGCEVGRALAGRIGANPFLGIHVAGFFDDRSLQRMNGAKQSEILGSLAQVAQYAKTHRVDLIYISLPMASQPRILRLLDDLHDTTASIYFTPDIFLFDLIQGRMDTIGGMPVVSVCETPFYGINGLIKRASDIALAAAILVTVLPLMAVVAIAIKLSSPGPVLFRQRRYGLDGREIIVYKFRTMTVLEDGSSIRQATIDDHRVTRLGRFLRRYSLDELPQFVNVLQGRMSVVGPRPHAVAHNEMYRKLIKGYMIRHKVKPGITGWAQVNGLRGEIRSLDKMRSRIDHDLDYLRRWSLQLDLWIVLKTIFVVLGQRNAY
jgi:putative colanic acid biosynthesis UDP-glucose lipid carrier transferase